MPLKDGLKLIICCNINLYILVMLCINTNWLFKYMWYLLNLNNNSHLRPPVYTIFISQITPLFISVAVLIQNFPFLSVINGVLNLQHTRCFDSVIITGVVLSLEVFPCVLSYLQKGLQYTALRNDNCWSGSRNSMNLVQYIVKFLIYYLFRDCFTPILTPFYEQAFKRNDIFLCFHNIRIYNFIFI